MKTALFKINFFLFFTLVALSGYPQSYDTTKPWTYWFWMGSAVDKANLDIELEEFKRSGIGGV
ncbi:MAG: hypothetical protein AAGA66_20560, partial [Bacteroidota bacterium]